MSKHVKIAHLYYDILNLYGENGNIRAISRFLKLNDIDADITRFGLNDYINFNDFDIFYIGCGNEESKFIVLENIMQYKEDIKKVIEMDKCFIATGNSIELFGNTIERSNGRLVDGLGIFNFNTTYTNNHIVKDNIYDFNGDKIVGFVNRKTNIDFKDNKLFNEDSMQYKSFYGMHFVGPILVRNPILLDNILKNLCDKMGYPYNENLDSLSYDAYRTYLKNFLEN